MDTSDDPISILGIGATVGQVMAQRQQGRNMNAVAKANARIDEMNAAAAAREAEVSARNLAEKGSRLVASQRAGYATGNVRVESGAPNVVAAETKDAILQDIGYIRERGETARQGYMYSANLQREQGRFAEKQSRWQALNAGLMGAFKFGSMIPGVNSLGANLSYALHPNARPDTEGTVIKAHTVNPDLWETE